MKITIYTTPSCPYSKLAKDYLTEKGFEFEEKDVLIPENANEKVKISDHMGVPVIDIGGHIIAGWDKDRIDKALDIIPRKIATETVKFEDLVDPKVEEEARTLERITSMLPKQKPERVPYDRDIGERINQGFNDCRSEVIALLPQIIEEAQRAKVEEMRKMFEKKSIDELKDLMGIAYNELPVKVAFKEGYNNAISIILSKLK